MNKLKKPEFANVFVICCTNDPSSLDGAIRRRFTFINVGMPAYEDRIELFKHYLNDNHSLTPKDLELLALKTDGFSCYDIEKVVATTVTFFYQEMFFNGSANSSNERSLEGRFITLEELKHVIENTSPSVDYYQLHDNEVFRQKHNFVTPTSNVSGNNFISHFNKKSFFGRFISWLFGHSKK